MCIEKQLEYSSRGEFPFSFTYDGVLSAALLNKWEKVEVKEELGDRIKKVVTLKDTATGFAVSYEITVFKDYSAAEWILYFENTGAEASPIIQEVNSLDLVFNRHRQGNIPYLLHQTNGADTCSEDLIMHQIPLCEGSHYTMGGGLGNSSKYHLPYFRVDMEGASIIIAVGWSGQWKADIRCIEGKKLHVTSGLEKTRFRLYPGERVRSPRMLMLYCEGQGWESNVQFRRLIREHYNPDYYHNGKQMETFIIASSWATFGLGFGLNGATEANQLPLVELSKHLGAEVFLTDTGWFEGDFPKGAGNWTRISKERYPNGFGPLAKAVQESGMIFGLWFDAERVIAGTDIAEEHPGWLLWKNGENKPIKVWDAYTRGTEDLKEWGYYDDTLKETKDPFLKWIGTAGGNPWAFLYHIGNVLKYHGCDETAVLNFGLKEVQDYFFEVMDNLLKIPGFKGYRHDMNLTSHLPYFISNDPPERQGITEMKYFEGLYAYWDRLLTAHPDMLFNNCHRIDLECVRRSHITQYSDHDAEAPLFYSLSQYIPAGRNIAWNTRMSADGYKFQSILPSSPILGFDKEYIKSESGIEQIKKLLEQYQEIRNFINRDWYPLTEYSNKTTDWLGSQYHNPDVDEGILLIYRREDCQAESIMVKPQFIDEKAEYNLKMANGFWGQKN